MHRLTAPLLIITLAAPLVGPGPAEAAAVRCDGRRATIAGGPASEVLTGTPGDDVIAGLGGSDTIDGKGGDDLICGGYGADRLSGGRGNDRLLGGPDRLSVTDEETSRTGDTLRGGPGNDRLVPGRDRRAAEDVNPDAILWDTSPRRVVLDLDQGVARGDGRDSFVGHGAWVVGSPYGDVIDGSPRADLINAGRGSDVVRARAGDDRVVADASGSAARADDEVWGGRGDDQLSSDQGEDEVHGGPGDDVVDDFGNSADRLFGDGGRDLLLGELTATALPQAYRGGPGVDRLHLFTNLLNPTASATLGTWDMATGSVDHDLAGPGSVTAGGFERADLSTYGTTWEVRGTSGGDVLTASGTAGTFFSGLAGDDRFSGSASDDRFDGGPGIDRSLGMGVGDDTCVDVEVFDQDDCEHVS